MSDNDLKELRDRFDEASTNWEPIRQEGRIDMRYVAGDPWDPNDKQQRVDASRPCLSLDELGQYFNQTINDLRMNPRGVKFSPTGSGSNDKVAEFYESKVREIEYRSHAQIAYLTAAENMIQRSYGWLRVNLRYPPGQKTFDQELWIDPIPNPDCVVPDPEAKRPDMSDMRYLFYAEQWPKRDFERKFPKAKTINFSADMQAIAPRWNPSADTITLAEYWKVRQTKRKLVELMPPTPPAMPGMQPGAMPPLEPILVFADELEKQRLPPGAQASREREIDWPEVRQQLTNGVEILDETDWPGLYIPFVAALGKVLYLDQAGANSKLILSMTRLARDAYMAYCFYRTSEIENVGLTTKNPYWAYEGQLSADQMNQIKKSLHEPVAVLTAKPMVEGMMPGSGPLPLPQRTMQEAQIQALSMGAEEMRRAIQAAMGISPLPTEAQRQNQKSGTALRQIESSGQRGSFHFVDHYEDMIRQTGVILEDLIPKVHSGKQDVGVRDVQGKGSMVRVNDPQAQEPLMLQGNYQVTVSAGPALESERAAADQFIDSFVGQAGNLAQVIGPQNMAGVLAMSIRLKQLGPLGDKLADLIEPQEMKQNDGKPPDPRIGKLQAENQHLTQQVQGLAIERATEKAKFDGQIALEQLKSKHELELKRMDIAAKIEVARISAAKQSADAAAEANEERIALGVNVAHEHVQNALDRQHEMGMARTAALAPPEPPQPPVSQSPQ